MLPSSLNFGIILIHQAAVRRQFRHSAHLEKKTMSSIDTQFLNLKEHHAQYPDINPKAALQGSAAGKTVFLSGTSRYIDKQMKDNDTFYLYMRIKS